MKIENNSDLKEIKDLIFNQILKQKRELKEKDKLISKLCKNPPKNQVEMALLSEFLKRTGININDFKRIIAHHQERIETIKMQNSTIELLQNENERLKTKCIILSKADVESKEPKTIQKTNNSDDDEIEMIPESDIKISKGNISKRN